MTRLWWLLQGDFAAERSLDAKTAVWISRESKLGLWPSLTVKRLKTPSKNGFVGGEFLKTIVLKMLLDCHANR